MQNPCIVPTLRLKLPLMTLKKHSSHHSDRSLWFFIVIRVIWDIRFWNRYTNTEKEKETKRDRKRERERDKDREWHTEIERNTILFLFAPCTFKAASYWCFATYDNLWCNGCIQCKYTPHKVCWNKYRNTSIAIDTWFFFVVYIFFSYWTYPSRDRRVCRLIICYGNYN
jgi:hypothetical protein